MAATPTGMGTGDEAFGEALADAGTEAGGATEVINSLTPGSKIFWIRRKRNVHDSKKRRKACKKKERMQKKELLSEILHKESFRIHRDTN